MSRFWSIVAAWAALVLIGYVLVFTLGAPLPTKEEQLAAAMNLTPPVSEQAARESAATIVRLEHGGLANFEPTVERKNDFGIDYWLITYTDDTGPAPMAVLISIGVATGEVTVATFP